MLKHVSRFHRRVLAGLTATALSLPMLFAAPSGAEDDVPQSEAVNRLQIVGTETDGVGRKIIMRHGIWIPSAGTQGRGFGWEKVKGKHAIYSKHSVGYVLKNPDGGEKAGKYRRKYDAWANKLVKKNGAWVVVDDRRVFVVTDSKKRDGNYHTVKMRGNRAGVVTAYCANPDFTWPCPSWVDRAIGDKAPRSVPETTEPDDATTETVWTYEPITEQQVNDLNEDGEARGVRVS